MIEIPDKERKAKEISKHSSLFTSCGDICDIHCHSFHEVHLSHHYCTLTYVYKEMNSFNEYSKTNGIFITCTHPLCVFQYIKKI